MSIKVTATRRLQFAAGHRVFGHESKCANIHGHNYVVFLHAEADKLDDIGRVIDFSVLKEKFGDWIDQNWDHGMLVYEADPLSNLWNYELLNQHKVFRAPFNPTAEEMAKYLLFTIGPNLLKGTPVRLVKVVLWETENCFAEASF